MTSPKLLAASRSTRTEEQVRRLHITSVSGPHKRRRAQAERYDGVDPSDIDPETGAPYDNYSSPCIEPHPFGGGIPAGEY